MSHCDRLGINRPRQHVMFIHLLGVMQIAQCRRQRVQRAGLATDWITDDHQSVTHQNHIIDLNDFLGEPRCLLQVAFGHVLSQAVFQCVVVGSGQNDAREEITDDAVEERDVGRQELEEITFGVMLAV